MRVADFDVEKLASRAGDGGTTLTELADTLVRDHGLPFRIRPRDRGAAAEGAHRGSGGAAVGALSKASTAILGRALDYTEAELAAIMSPQHFVEVRTTYGGPAPSETARALG